MTCPFCVRPEESRSTFAEARPAGCPYLNVGADSASSSVSKRFRLGQTTGRTTVDNAAGTLGRRMENTPPFHYKNAGRPSEIRVAPTSGTNANRGNRLNCFSAWATKRAAKQTLSPVQLSSSSIDPQIEGNGGTVLDGPSSGPDNSLWSRSVKNHGRESPSLVPLCP